MTQSGFCGVHLRDGKKALSEEAARDELRSNAGGQFDPAVVEAFLAATSSRETSAEPANSVTDPADGR